MTALAEAFSSAGYRTAEDRLADLVYAIAKVIPLAGVPVWEKEIADKHQQERLATMAREALAEKKLWDAAKEQLYRLVRKDPELVWAMFAPYRAQAAQSLLSAASRELRELEATARPQPSAGALAGVNAKGRMPPRSTIRPSAAIPTIDQQRAAMGAWAAVVQLSMLDKFIINGQPIGDLTSREAIKWAGSQERDARFVRLLTANLPADEPIRKFRTGEDAAAIYAQAEAANV